MAPNPVAAPASGEQGCDHGFWKNDKHFGLWTGYTPGDNFDAVFGIESSFGGTLLDALERGGGGERALARQGVAALLNSTATEVNYSFTQGQVIQIVQGAYASEDFNPARREIEKANKQDCPLK